MIAIDPRRVVVATVFENRMPYAGETEVLFRTLLANGGRLADARKIAYSVGPAHPLVVEVLGDLGVEVREVAPFDERCPHANKLAMFEPVPDSDLLLALDTDIAFAGDPLPWLSGTSVAAKPVDADPIGLELWPDLFTARGLKLPSARHLTLMTGAETIGYFNSGVVAVPTRWCEALRSAWADEISWLLDHGDQLPERFVDQSFFTDQFGLALALARLDLPVRALPAELNYPTHIPVARALLPDTVEPILLHHHHRTDPDEGTLLPTGAPGPDSAIAVVNAELLREPTQPTAPTAPLPGQLAFDNQAFWNHRYLTDMELGSGVGSRGPVAVQKRALIQGLIDRLDIRTIIDVGCGDIEIVQQLDYDGDYLGVDIAEAIVERNRRLMPAWRFEHGDFVSLASVSDVSADLVMCFDVLIHQHEAAYYEAFVSALVRSAGKAGVVAAYEARPTGEFASDITAFHEPITTTLARSGARDVRIIDEYRGTAVVAFAPAQ